MKTIQVLAVVLTLSSFTVLAAEPTPNPASRFYPLVGNWAGNGLLSENGQAPAKLAMSVSCRKASAGFAVLCDMKAHNEKMKLAETDLFGVDPVTGKGHWFSVTNTGETHDHIADWTDARTMKARYAWIQDGKKMEENIVMVFKNPRHIDFHSVVTSDAKEVVEFKGMLKR